MIISTNRKQTNGTKKLPKDLVLACRRGWLGPVPLWLKQLCQSQAGAPTPGPLPRQSTSCTHSCPFQPLPGQCEPALCTTLVGRPGQWVSRQWGNTGLQERALVHLSQTRHCAGFSLPLTSPGNTRCAQRQPLRSFCRNQAHPGHSGLRGPVQVQQGTVPPSVLLGVWGCSETRGWHIKAHISPQQGIAHRVWGSHKTDCPPVPRCP